MGLWLVRDVPTWLVAICLIGGIPAVMVGVDVLIHRRLPHRRLGRHNVVTGMFVSVIGVAYGIIVGHCLVSLWDKHSDGERIAREESANLVALAETSRVFGPDIERRVTGEVRRYNEAVVRGWGDRVRGISGRDEAASLDALSDLIDSLEPTEDPQRIFVSDAVTRLAHGRELRQQALDEAADQQIPGMVWFALGATAIAVLLLCLLFGIDDGFVRRVLLSLVSVVVATNLFVVVEMNYPYYGSFCVSSGSYRQVADALGDGG